jgi:hypothetical protein
MEVGETHALAGELIEIWRFKTASAVHPEVPVSQIVRKNDDDIGRSFACCCRLLSHNFPGTKPQQACQTDQAIHHRNMTLPGSALNSRAPLSLQADCRAINLERNWPNLTISPTQKR